MTAKEYLSRVGYLEKAISYKMKEIDYWKEMAKSMTAHGMEEHYNPNRPQDATFTRCFEMIEEIQHEIDEKTAELITLRREIDIRIELLQSFEEQLVLRYRYLESMNWRQVERVMHVSRATMFKIHGRALAHFAVPSES